MEKKETKKPLTAEDFLSMPDEELHAWVERKFAERLAEYERRDAKDRVPQDETE